MAARRSAPGAASAPTARTQAASTPTMMSWRTSTSSFAVTLSQRCGVSRRGGSGCTRCCPSTTDPRASSARRPPPPPAHTSSSARTGAASSPQSSPTSALSWPAVMTSGVSRAALCDDPPGHGPFEVVATPFSIVGDLSAWIYYCIVRLSPFPAEPAMAVDINQDFCHHRSCRADMRP